MNDLNETAAAAAEAPAKTKIRPDLKRYIRDKSGNGKRTHRTDDFVARTLAGKSIEVIRDCASQLGVDHNKWSALNIGQQRMLIGNKLRHWLYGTKPTLTEQQVTGVFGEPVPEHVASDEQQDAGAVDKQNPDAGEVIAAPAVDEQPSGKVGRKALPRKR
jgi:hypothetical protein